MKSLRFDTLSDAQEFVSTLGPVECERLIQACIERARPRSLEVRIGAARAKIVHLKEGEK